MAMYIWKVHKYNRCSNPFAMCEHQTFFRYLVIISHHQQRYRNHYYHHHQNHHHKHQLDKTIRVARVTTVVSHSAIIILRWRWGRSLILLQRRISGNGDSSSPAEEKQGRPTMLLRKRKRLEENDKKSGKSRRVWKSLWGSYAAGTGTFLMCGHHFVQHEEDVGAHLPSLLHSGFPQ